MKLIMPTKLIYDGNILRQARIAQNKSIGDIAYTLCSSSHQISDIELNSATSYGFLRQIVIKRYAELLNIDLNTVVTQFESDLDIIN
ncbi:helix-turn-helix domain-containing protein [Candidatus Methylopumilus universalis]|jgi:cytoskeletal protein RodZ|uniref:helix-turn-helix domain-containing protein n=2 Tax=Candidatus Methylopumilus universalis TaxID=2588536 RepID=UPI003BEEF2FC